VQGQPSRMAIANTPVEQFEGDLGLRRFCRRPLWPKVVDLEQTTQQNRSTAGSRVTSSNMVGRSTVCFWREKKLCCAERFYQRRYCSEKEDAGPLATLIERLHAVRQISTTESAFAAVLSQRLQVLGFDRHGGAAWIAPGRVAKGPIQQRLQAALRPSNAIRVWFRRRNESCAVPGAARQVLARARRYHHVQHPPPKQKSSWRLNRGATVVSVADPLCKRPTWHFTALQAEKRGSTETIEMVL